MYGLSSSTISSAFTTIQRRCIHQSQSISKKLNPLKITNKSPARRHLRPSKLAWNSAELTTSRQIYQHGRNQHQHIFPFSLTYFDQERLYPATKYNQYLVQTQHRRQMISLFSTTSNDVEGTSNEISDSDDIASKQQLDVEKTTLEYPAFRLFYNDVYEVKLPPGSNGEISQGSRKGQEKIAKSPLEGAKCDFQVSPLATFEELSTTHDPNYITRFLEGDQTEQEQRNVGFPWSPSGVDRALSSVGGTLAAACFVCDRLRQQRQQLQRNESLSSSQPLHIPPSWAAHIAGGTHHAFYDYGEGFSVFSDMAVAANVVLDRYPDVIQNNILMIDLDVHQGNGNAVLFQSNGHNLEDGETSTNVESSKSDHSNRVFTFSMHCSGNYFSEKQESDLDIELPIGCQDQAYLMTLNHWLKRFRKEHYKSHNSKEIPDIGEEPQRQKDTQQSTNYKWDLVIFQAGVDVLDDDRLGRMSLSPNAVARRNELVYEFASDLGVPLVICMGGGYPKRDDWESIIETHSEVYCGAHSFLSEWSSRNKKSEE
eukprot:CAMPEP_0116114510 /NCGR_PEP_ID=MMETSP0329-20121206/20_1 /TAXON_ID=697910 /ORGANISM="Pseudo-nitzschia arenysensis, Strain B593" /LENGTH=538 /DNA_ID=CAMNT_0003607897 /DNA_START=185 /DNA_END=1802 /DNA_ORIENTATION=+